jgi:hypothetical protein
MVNKENTMNKTYIHYCPINEQVCLTSTPYTQELCGTCIEYDAKSALHVYACKYIECTSLVDGVITIDLVKVLAIVLNERDVAISIVVDSLRKLMVEAFSMGKIDVHAEIVTLLQTIIAFKDEDLSHLNTVVKIDSYTIPELNLDYEDIYYGLIYTV